VRTAKFVVAMSAEQIEHS